MGRGASYLPAGLTVFACALTILGWGMRAACTGRTNMWRRVGQWAWCAYALIGGLAFLVSSLLAGLLPFAQIDVDFATMTNASRSTALEVVCAATAMGGYGLICLDIAPTLRALVTDAPVVKADDYQWLVVGTMGGCDALAATIWVWIS